MHFIKERLHDLDSAEFEHSEKASVVTKGHRVFVARTVRAKNGFNALRRAEYICLMEFHGDVILPKLIAERGTRDAEAAALLKTWNF